MALFTSVNGYFEVTAVSFSPKIITVGEETTYSVTIKNTSGKKITSMYMCMGLFYPDAAGRVSRSTDVYMYGGPSFQFASVSWEANASKTFTGKFKFTTSSYHTYLPNITTRLMPLFDAASYTGGSKRGMMIQIVAGNTIFADGTNGDDIYDIRGENSEYLAVIDARYSPTILKFEGERSDEDGALNDEGLALLANIALAKSEAANTDAMSLQAYYLNEATPDEDPVVLDLTDMMDSALASEIQTILTEVALNTNADYTVTLWFGDQYESVTATVPISRAFANVHLSGLPTGGVCFGGFSRSEEGKPLFECYYPAEFYNGITGVTNFSTEEVPTGGTWIDGKPIYRITVSGSVSTTSGTAKSAVIATLTNVATVVNLYGVVSRNSSIFPMALYVGSSNYHSVAYASGEVLLASTHSAAAYVTIEYTKTTD